MDTKIMKGKRNVNNQDNFDFCRHEPSEDEIDNFDLALRSKFPTPNRTMAPIMYYGGKGMLASKIAAILPSGKVYCEPFCGAASVFWHIEKSLGVEVLNDLDGNVINLFRVLQDRKLFKEFTHRITWTPYSLSEFEKAIGMVKQSVLSPVDRAWAFYVRQNQGFSGRAETKGDWGRSFRSERGVASMPNKWRGRQKLLEIWHERLLRVQLDNRDALEVIKYWDSPGTVFYLDPPYVASTRVAKEVYLHESNDDFHGKLVDVLFNIAGKFVLSGYDNAIYAKLETICETSEIETACMAAGRTRNSGLQGKGSLLGKAPRTEKFWMKL